MASPFPGQPSAFQIGSYFVNHYYQILQSRPDLVHQFYTNISTMCRFDCNTMETATAIGMQQIHNVFMCLNLNGIEIKTLHCLDSWGGGILVMVSGFVQLKVYSSRRRFIETFFLAPQDKGYFVLNDMFQSLDEEHNRHHPTASFIHNDYETNMNIVNPVPEPVSNYVTGEKIQSNELLAPVQQAEETDTVNEYSIHEPQQEVSPDLESNAIIDEAPVEEQESLSPPPCPISIVQDPNPTPEEEPVGEPPRQTYASVLRTKGQYVPPVPNSIPLNKTTVVNSELQSTQQSQSALVCEKSTMELAQEASMGEDEGELLLSVYVGNLSPSTSISDLEEEFKTFGRIKPDGVAIRSRKEAGVFYAFVEFEDITGVHNALKASPIDLHGRLIHIEERRPNSGLSRGGRRGRGRGGYSSESSRGRFGGRSFGRGSGLDTERDFVRPRGNGYQRRGLLQEGGILGNQGPRNTRNPLKVFP